MHLLSADAISLVFLKKKIQLI